MERLLKRCDRKTAVGRRNHAILLLLARLGLRAGEVIKLSLDDIDWDSGQISANTIKRNELAYKVYLANCRKPKMGKLPEPALRVLVGSSPPERRHALEVKVSRLRREPKDALIARLISLESTIAGQRDAENRLREEILRLSTQP